MTKPLIRRTESAVKAQLNFALAKLNKLLLFLLIYLVPGLCFAKNSDPTAAWYMLFLPFFGMALLAIGIAHLFMNWSEKDAQRLQSQQGALYTGRPWLGVIFILFLAGAGLSAISGHPLGPIASAVGGVVGAGGYIAWFLAAGKNKKQQ